MMLKSAGKLLLVIGIVAAMWGAWALSQRSDSADVVPINAKFVLKEVRYEAI